MKQYDISISREQMAGLLSEENVFGDMVREVINQVLQAQMSEHLGADKYERNDDRVGMRNGNRTRQLKTRVGTLVLTVPQTRDGSFSTDLFRKYQRNEQALVLSIMEMYVQGVSTRKVTEITEQLCGTSFSKSTVSQLCMELDMRVKAFAQRRLEVEYPVLMVDALYIKSRQADDRIISRGVFITTGINAKGYREIIGIDVMNSESTGTWVEAFNQLKARGLKGVRWVVSDAHEGLQQAIKQCFTGATWQRCQVHLMRNILGQCSTRHRAEVAAAVKLVLQAPDLVEARRRQAEFVERFAKSAPKAVACLEAGFEDAMAVMALPEKYRKRLRTTNMQERLNEEIRRRERVIRIFPNDDSALRLIGAMLAEQNEVWQERKYLDMDEFTEWATARTAACPDHDVVVRVD